MAKVKIYRRRRKTVALLLGGTYLAGLGATTFISHIWNTHDGKDVIHASEHIGSGRSKLRLNLLNSQDERFSAQSLILIIM